MYKDGDGRSDSDLLMKLSAAGEVYGLPWVCRHSTSGRGLRLHQTRRSEDSPNHNVAGLRVYDTPEEALRAFLAESGNNNTGVIVDRPPTGYTTPRPLFTPIYGESKHSDDGYAHYTEPPAND